MNISNSSSNVITNASKMRASWIPLETKNLESKAKWMQLGYVIVHDESAKISVNKFDSRYKGKRSKFGKYLRDLQANGIDISSLLTGTAPLDKDTDDLATSIAKRLYEAFAQRSVVQLQAHCSKCSLPSKQSVKKIENWDWNSPAAKGSKFYKMAARLIQEHDPVTLTKIVNVITGHA